MASLPPRDVISHDVQSVLEQRSLDDPSLVRFETEKTAFNPLANRLVIGPGKAVRYEWPISEAEHAEIVTYLGEEYEKGPVLGATFVQDPQELCDNCGTPSTFSDLVRIAMQDSVHSPAFMINGIRKDLPGLGEIHHASCKNCGIRYKGSHNWASGMGWGDLKKELCGKGSG